MGDKDVGGILAALEPVFDRIVVTHNGSPRALDVESLALVAQQYFGPDRVITAESLRDAIDTATALVDDADAEGVASPERASSSPVRWSPPAPRARCSVVIPRDGARPTTRRVPKPDPWKSFRGVTAGTLILEAIVVLLALPVVGAVGGGLSAGALTYLLGLAAVLILLAGLQGRSWAIWADLAVQLIPIAGFAVYPGVGFIGLLFAAVWALILYVRSEVLRRERLGLLPGQDGPPD